ncbi:MAG: 1-deoxy-D-xylulose-5-phosphate synthase [bacterium TMED198]|nr:MAG: 1-deoxy-D-xylulose-5-phosphate synthase [bacterium TMED198]
MKKYKLLDKIDSPEDIKSLNVNSLGRLSQEVCDFIDEVIKKTGGHYSSPLGVVDLTIALHYVYNSPKDKILWDVGHQAYSHKILTGRREEFKRIRNKGGISGFLKISESPHDAFGAGHASTSISAALGFAHSRDKLKQNSKVVAVIGDGALTGGLAYEGINNLGYHKTQMTIILNDNSMSISKSVGALSHYLTKVITNPTYNKIRNDIWDLSGKVPVISKQLRKFLRKTEEGLKGYLTPGALFEDLGLRYIGPIDGHNLEELIQVLNSIREMNTPVILHVYTKKGRGVEKAENNSLKYYSLSGAQGKNISSTPSYSSVLGSSLSEIAKNDSNIVAVTAAMEVGTGLSTFTDKNPEKYIDVGIAEEHAVTYAAGLAASGMKPVVCLYSTFLQRAYDNVFHDVSLQNLPVIFCLDRAGLVGPDGPTHHGIYDISLFRNLPNVVLSAPKDGNELKSLLLTAVKSNKIFFIRYPKGSCIKYSNDSSEKLNIGSWEKLNDGKNIALLCIGSMVNQAQESIDIFKSKNIPVPTIVNCRFIKPFDSKLLKEIAITHKCIITFEEAAVSGGFGTSILEYCNSIDLDIKIINVGVPDEYVEHAKRSEQLSDLGLDSIGIFNKVQKVFYSDEK